MADSDIDFERVITDPIYRRKVIEQLKTEAPEEARRDVEESIKAMRERSDPAA